MNTISCLGRVWFIFFLLIAMGCGTDEAPNQAASQPSQTKNSVSALKPPVATESAARSNSPVKKLTLEFAHHSQIDRSKVQFSELDVGQLPHNNSKPMIIAARFGPEGLNIQDGCRVTWPLPKKVAANSKLFVLYLNEETQTWENTGEQAVVGATGLDASGYVYHFSSYGLSDDEAPVRCTTAGDQELHSDQLNYAQQLLMLINHKQKLGLMDVRPTEELDSIVEYAGPLPRMYAEELIKADERTAIDQIDNAVLKWLAQKANDFFDPEQAADRVLTGSQRALEILKTELTNGEASQRAEREIFERSQEIAELFKQEHTSQKPSSTTRKQRVTAMKRRTAAYGFWLENRRALESMERSSNVLKELERVFGVYKTINSKGEGLEYGHALAVGLSGALKTWNDDLIGGAKKLVEIQKIDAQKMIDRWEQKATSRRGSPAKWRSYLVKEMCGYETEFSDAMKKVDIAERDVKIIEGVSTVLSGLQTVLVRAKSLYDTYQRLTKEQNQLIEDYSEIGATRDMQLFARFMKNSADILKPLVGMLGETPVGIIATSYVDGLTEMARVPAGAYKLVDASLRGAGTGDKIEGFYLADEVFYDNRAAWKLRVGFNQNNSKYAVPQTSSGFFRDPVELNNDQYLQLQHAASTLTSLKGANISQTKLHELAAAIASGRANERISLTHRKWDHGTGTFLADKSLPETYFVSELLSSNGRRWLELESGHLLQRHRNISWGLSQEDRRKIKLSDLVSDDAPRNARVQFMKFNNLWNRLDPLWQDVYGVSLPPSMFAAVLGFEAQRRTEIDGPISERTAQNVSPIERRLIKLRNQLKSSDPPPKIRIVNFNVKRPAWDQVHCSMTYQATMLKPDTRICRYFRIKVGELPFLERNPQKIQSWHSGAQITADLRRIPAHALDQGRIDVEAVVEVDGQPKTVQKQTLFFDPPVRIDQFELVAPNGFQKGEPVLFSMLAYLDDAFQPEQPGEVEFLVVNKGDFDNPIAVFSAGQVQVMANHTVAVDHIETGLPEMGDLSNAQLWCKISFPDGTNWMRPLQEPRVVVPFVKELKLKQDNETFHHVRWDEPIVDTPNGPQTTEDWIVQNKFQRDKGPIDVTFVFSVPVTNRNMQLTKDPRISEEDRMSLPDSVPMLKAGQRVVKRTVVTADGSKQELEFTEPYDIESHSADGITWNAQIPTDVFAKDIPRRHEPDPGLGLQINAQSIVSSGDPLKLDSDPTTLAIVHEGNWYGYEQGAMYHKSQAIRQPPQPSGFDSYWDIVATFEDGEKDRGLLKISFNLEEDDAYIFLLRLGLRVRAKLDGVTFTGEPGNAGGMGAVVRSAKKGETSLTLTMNPGPPWPLPTYETGYKVSAKDHAKIENCRISGTASYVESSNGKLTKIKIAGKLSYYSGQYDEKNEPRNP